MNCLIINNPFSGKCKSIADLDHIKTRLLEKYKSVDIINTTARNDAIFISAENCLKYHTCVVVGGDGTYSEVLQGIISNDIRPIVGYIPTGTVNDFAKSCNIPCDIDSAVDIILKGTSIKRSLMFVNGKVAVYIVASGFSTSSSYNTPQKSKKKLGKFAYYWHVLIKDKYRGGIKLKVITDRVHEAKFIGAVFLHGLSAGGMRLSRSFNHNADHFNAILVKRGRGILCYALSLGRMLKIIMRKIENIKPNKHIIIEKVKSIIVSPKSQDIIWNVDGEKGATGDINISIKSNQYQAIIGA